MTLFESELSQESCCSNAKLTTNTTSFPQNIMIPEEHSQLPTLPSMVKQKVNS